MITDSLSKERARGFFEKINGQYFIEIKSVQDEIDAINYDIDYIVDNYKMKKISFFARSGYENRNFKNAAYLNTDSAEIIKQNLSGVFFQSGLNLYITNPDKEKFSKTFGLSFEAANADNFSDLDGKNFITIDTSTIDGTTYFSENSDKVYIGDYNQFLQTKLHFDAVFIKNLKSENTEEKYIVIYNIGSTVDFKNSNGDKSKINIRSSINFFKPDSKIIGGFYLAFNDVFDTQDNDAISKLNFGITTKFSFSSLVDYKKN